MMKIIGNSLYKLFPYSRWCSPEKYAAKTFESADFKANVAALQAAATTATNDDVITEFREIANAKIADEASRHASIIGRAQSLFVTLAIFGILATLGSSLFTQTTRIERPVLWLCLAIVVYILLQMFFMVINILRAIGGIGYPSAGSSDLTKWLGMPDKIAFFRAQALLTLDHYRIAALNNNWRFLHLGGALIGLRNIVFALIVLILTLFIAAIVTPPRAPAAAETITVIVPDKHFHRHYRWWDN